MQEKEIENSLSCTCIWRWFILHRFKTSSIPSNVSKGVPDFCTVYVISKGKISSARSASRPAPHSSPLLSVIHELSNKQIVNKPPETPRSIKSLRGGLFHYIWYQTFSKLASAKVLFYWKWILLRFSFIMHLQVRIGILSNLVTYKMIQPGSTIFVHFVDCVCVKSDYIYIFFINFVKFNSKNHVINFVIFNSKRLLKFLKKQYQIYPTIMSIT